MNNDRFGKCLAFQHITTLHGYVGYSLILNPLSVASIACSCDALDPLRVPRAHALGGGKAHHVFLLVTFQFCPFILDFFIFFQNLIDIKCLLSCVNYLVANSLYSSLGLSLYPYFTCLQRLSVSLFIYWIRCYRFESIFQLHVLNFHPN